MIQAHNDAGGTKSVLTVRDRRIDTDTSPPAGQGDGVKPHELLEAALASCAVITLRMVADQRGMALERADVTVEVDRSDAEETVFRTKAVLHGNLTADERAVLLRAIDRCPVRRTLSKRLAFATVSDA